MFHGQGNDSDDFISNVNCTGDEESIADCEHSNAQVADCNDVAVICSGIQIIIFLSFFNTIITANRGCDDQPIARLIDNTTATEGLVDVCIFGGYRAGLCYSDITTQTATLLCRQLGFTTLQGIPSDPLLARFAN